LACSKITAARYESMGRDGHVALAFGAPVTGIHGAYLPLDAVAMRLAGELTPHVGRDDATGIVLSHWPSWVESVARTEIDDRPMFFAVGFKGSGKAREYLITAGTPDEIIRDFGGFDQNGVILLNVSKVVADVRRIATEVGFDLHEAFFYPPGHPQYEPTLKEGERNREVALARLRERNPKKFRREMSRKPVGRVAAR